ncbi:MAG: sulfotransferase family 2 domain-containing protein [Verrucomicrobia bacterium]|nr:sulfotransferase family 2 domain-containing protein [Verrucomicrobiota bacterium]
MIISDTHKYVYIGIPRNASKSMNHWLCEYFDGRNHGGHHDYDVPEEAAEYLVFTLVRNPYDRYVSSHFAVTWDEQGVTEEELRECRSAPERLRKIRAVLKTRERQRQRECPQQSPVPLAERIRVAAEKKKEDGHGMNQKRFVDLAGVDLVLYFERLPQCLRELPFVDPTSVPPFSHHPERGIRPSGTFFDLFRDTDEEQVVWAYAAEDFEAFGYRRFDCGLPRDAANALRIR